MTACYDKHVHDISEVVLKAHGVNRDGVSTIMKVIRGMETKTQTTFGLSKKSYRSTNNETIYGTGKGNITLVFICQFGTSCIFYMLDEEFCGWEVVNEEGKVVGVKVAIRFVDDTDFFLKRETNSIELTEALYNRYIQLYEATGGVISLDKSVFYHWKWEFRNGKLEIRDLIESHNMSIKQLNTATGTRTLGMKLESELHFQDATDFIGNKIDKFNTRMSRSPLCPSDVNVTYQSFFKLSVYYRVKEISINNKQSKEIDGAWTIPWVHRIDISQKTNVNIRYMLREDGDLEMFKVKDVILIKKAKHLQGCLMVGGRIGHQIRSNIAHAQIFSGLEESILQTQIFYKP